jgi:hypothetical protein
MFREANQLCSGGGTVISATCVKQRELIRGQVVAFKESNGSKESCASWYKITLLSDSFSLWFSSSSETGLFTELWVLNAFPDLLNPKKVDCSVKQAMQAMKKKIMVCRIFILTSGKRGYKVTLLNVLICLRNRRKIIKLNCFYLNLKII